MAERKRWDKHPDVPFPHNSSSLCDAKADPVLTKQLQYIKVLEERNRVKKRLAAASKRNERLQEREEAFVTAFNVPARAAQSTSSFSSRSSRSATSVLPTKLQGTREEVKLSKCRSAPSTTLNFADGGGTDKGTEMTQMRRAKWNRPQAPMGVAVEHQDGVPQFRLTTHEKEENDEEDDYLEESFEEFDEEDDEREFSRTGGRVHMEELVIQEMDDDVERDDDVKATARDAADSKAVAVDNIPVDFSKTTKELLGIIQHLSRPKQRALVDVLQKFQASEQDENDVKVLQSSIGDSVLWKEMTSAFNSSSLSPVCEKLNGCSTATASHSRDPLTVAPLQNLLEEQLRSEDEMYATEVKERLTRERREKHRMLKEAEERRAKIMKQLEDEEGEIERLLEVKRQERLAKLRALQEEAAMDEPPVRVPTIVASSSDKLEEQTATMTTEALNRHIFSQEDDELYAADAKSTPLAPKSPEHGHLPAQNDLVDSKSFQEPIVVIPSLDLSFNSNRKSPTSIEGHEIRVKLLSTWSKTRAVGLTQICVYDLSGDELSVDLESLQLYDQPTGRPLPKTNDMVRGLQRLFNGVVQTTMKNMWLGRLGDSGVLLVRFEVPSTPSKLCVWNYNSKSHAACTRDVEVLVNGQPVWTGSLPETFGEADDNTCTWIDLLGTVRKTSRSARLETFRAEQQFAIQVDESMDRTPVWLSGTKFSLSTERLPITIRSRADCEPFTADEKLSSSTSRRRQGNPLYSARSEAKDEVKDVRAAMKSYSSQVINEQKDETPHRVTAPALASLSSWDSLEKFSKTNRSRLPQPTDTTESTIFEVESSEKQFEATSKGSSSRTSFTTSELLTELRQGATSSNFKPVTSSSYPEILKHSSSVQVYADNRQVNSDVAVHHDTITEIPVLPSGKWLKIEILSTWGDPYYVGLNGVEIFNERGQLVPFRDPARQVTACPESINVLEENSDDPRVPANLVDGVNLTCDDFHMWLAPFTPGQTHYVMLEMEFSVSLSMVRLWNYNKSRTHTCRGVRDARLVLFDVVPNRLSRIESKLTDNSGNSGKIIFEGEIRQAPGLVGADSIDISNEVILFTQETTILEAIEANDDVLRMISTEQEREDEETRQFVNTVHRSLELRRPGTSDGGSRIVEKSPKNQESDEDDRYQPRIGKDGRPMTMATRFLVNRDSRLRTSVDSWVAEKPQERSPVPAKVSEGVLSISDGSISDIRLPRGRRLTLELHSTWGDRNYIGLTQIEVLVGSHGTPIPLDIGNLDATPRDLASLGCIGDPRTLDKLIDGEATTCDDTHMWLVPFEAGTVPEVRIELKTAQRFYGLRVWNYNKSPEDTYRGVKQLLVRLDGLVISPQETGFLLRKAPGVADFSFSQLLRFSDDFEGPTKSPSYWDRVQYPFRTRAYKTPIIRQDYEAPLYPQGFLLKIICWTTWGDPYYLGLNGIELYDFVGARIVEKPAILTAVPYSVSEVDNSSRQQDMRTPENLMSNLNKNTWDAHDSWLAPLASSLGNPDGNIVYIGFDTPIVLSMIKFWNYSKTPERGVKEVDIYLDDMHLFSGTLKKAPVVDQTSNRLGKGHKVTEQFGQSVLFSSSQSQVDIEKRHVYYCGVEEQDVLGINEGQVMHESQAMYRKPDPGAEGVVVDLDLRPMTAMCRQ